MNEQLQVVSVADGELATVRLVGELDLSTVGPVDRELHRLAGGNRRILLDLGDLVFIDSMGIGLLVRWRSKLAGIDDGLQLRGVRGQVRQIFEMTSMLEHFRLADDG